MPKQLAQANSKEPWFHPTNKGYNPPLVTPLSAQDSSHRDSVSAHRPLQQPSVINAPHVSFWAETQHSSAEPYQKLQTKLLAWLRGELKSEANLLRFHEAFCEWRDAQPEDDSLAWRLLQFCCAALHSACETLFD